MKGIDISSYQGIVPWHTMDDITFGLTKVTEGEGYTNPFWKTNAVNMRVENKIRGFYTFSVPGLGHNTPEAEAAYFWSKIEDSVMKNDLIAVDAEKTKFAAPKQTSNWIIRLLEHLEYLAGWKPFIYSYPDFITSNLKDPTLSNWPLWLAWYKNTLPESFAQWKKIALWQQGPGKIKGTTGSIDIDIFFLTAPALDAYGKPS